MNIEELVDHMTEYLQDDPVPSIPQPCGENDILKAEHEFKAECGCNFPDAYKRVLRRANGVDHNGLIIWPAKPEPLFQETILQANADLRENFSGDFIYYGQMDEELYVFDLRTMEYCAIEYVGKPVWATFADADEMFQFMLERAWGDED